MTSMQPVSFTASMSGAHAVMTGGNSDSGSVSERGEKKHWS